MAAAKALHAGLFASTEAKQQTKSRNHEKAEQTPSPGEAPLGGNHLRTMALGTQSLRGIGILGLHGNVNRLQDGLRRLHRLWFGNGFGRQLRAAGSAKTAGRIIGDFDTAVFTTHNNSSFFIYYRGWRANLQRNNDLKNIEIKKMEVTLWQMTARS